MASAKQKLFRFYKGKPVKTMRRGPDGIVLIMLAAVKGQEGEKLVITQDEWDQHGKWNPVGPVVHMDSIRQYVTP